MRFIFTENDSFLPKQEIADEIKDFLGFCLVRRQQTFNLIGWYRNLVLFLFRHTRLLGYLDGFIYNSTSIYIKQPQKSLIENRFLSLLCFMLSLLLLVLCFQHFFTNSKSYPDYDKLFFGSRITFSSVLFSHVFFCPKMRQQKVVFFVRKRNRTKKIVGFEFAGGYLCLCMAKWAVLMLLLWPRDKEPFTVVDQMTSLSIWAWKCRVRLCNIPR